MLIPAYEGLYVGVKGVYIDDVSWREGNREDNIWRNVGSLIAMDESFI